MALLKPAGQPPFEVEDPVQTAQRIMHSPPVCGFPRGVSPECVSFIQQARSVTPRPLPALLQATGQNHGTRPNPILIHPPNNTCDRETVPEHRNPQQGPHKGATARGQHVTDIKSLAGMT